MESIKFYKLISPYSEDQTLNCKLTTSDIDENFLAFKDNDISASTFDCENMVLNIIRNNGEKIVIDLSCVREEFDEKLESSISGITPEDVEINLSGRLSENGVLTLTWTDDSGQHSTTISGFVGESTPPEIKHDATLKGTGSKCDPIGISNVEKTGYYKPVIAIIPKVDNEYTKSLNNPEIGDRVVKEKEVSLFGRLYSKEGLADIIHCLEKSGSVWRVPTKDDWDNLFGFIDVCGDISGETIGEYDNSVCGKMLKSVEYWNGNENLDEYGFFATPSGYISGSTLYDVGDVCKYWTDTEYESNVNYIKGFSGDSDGVLQDIEGDDCWYSIRLVRDICEDYVSDYENILGNNYKVINFPEIGQAWISINLNAEIDNSEFIDYYNLANSGSSGAHKSAENADNTILKTKYSIAQWNGIDWDEKELIDGDKFNLVEDRRVTEYTCVELEDGNQYLVKGIIYEVETRNDGNGENNGDDFMYEKGNYTYAIKKMIIDAGEY